MVQPLEWEASPGLTFGRAMVPIGGVEGGPKGAGVFSIGGVDDPSPGSSGSSEG